MRIPHAPLVAALLWTASNSLRLPQPCLSRSAATLGRRFLPTRTSLGLQSKEHATRGSLGGAVRRLQWAASWPARKVAAVSTFFQKDFPFLQFLWPDDSIRLRVYLLLALAFMFAGKYLNIQTPFILQRAIDNIRTLGVAEAVQQKVLVKSATTLLSLYGLSRAMSVVCAEIKTSLFAHVSQNVLRRFANEIFTHLHSLDNEFHQATPSGVISVAYARAVRGFQTTIFQIVFSVVPTFLELFLVSNILFRKFGPQFSAITLATFASYLAFTVWITQWRVAVRKELVDVDNTRNGFFIDSILNQEVIKLFTSEKREGQRFDGYLQRLEHLSIQSTYAIAILNLGQAALFCVGLTASLVIALQRVAAGSMSVGDLVAVNALLLQLAQPFNFIGYTYQELRQAFVDMSYMRDVLTRVQPSVVDTAANVSFDSIVPRKASTPSEVEFRQVTLKYRAADWSTSNSSAAAASSLYSSDGALASAPAPIKPPPFEYLLRNVSFTVKPGQSVALVGPSGSGKSTALRLITRMVEATSGAVLVDGVDTRDVSLESLRARVAVVPQDNTLFDNTIDYNIRYGNQDATEEEVLEAVERCNLLGTVTKFPEGLMTQTGERGLRLSGGERQKVSIARALLKSPSLILCDEVTSAVDAFAEREIVETLRQAASNRTTITVAHRLSSIMHCDAIVVLDAGRVVQQGSHAELMRNHSGVYARMWAAQQGGVTPAECDCDLDADSPAPPSSSSSSSYLSQSDSMSDLLTVGSAGVVGSIEVSKGLPDVIDAQMRRGLEVSTVQGGIAPSQPRADSFDGTI